MVGNFQKEKSTIGICVLSVFEAVSVGEGIDDLETHTLTLKSEVTMHKN
jgi:hypothetical protein